MNAVAEKLTVKETVQSEILGLHCADVMNKVTSYVKPVIDFASKGNTQQTESEYDLMVQKLEAVKELVVEEKTYQWQFRNVNDNYNGWQCALTYINNFLDMNFQAKLVKLLNKNK